MCDCRRASDLDPRWARRTSGRWIRRGACGWRWRRWRIWRTRRGRPDGRRSAGVIASLQLKFQRSGTQRLQCCEPGESYRRFNVEPVRGIECAGGADILVVDGDPEGLSAGSVHILILRKWWGFGVKRVGMSRKRLNLEPFSFVL